MRALAVRGNHLGFTFSKWSAGLFAGLVSLAGTAAEPSPAAMALEVGPGSTISLDGDSTFHKYSAKTQDFSATFDLVPTAKTTASSKTIEALFRDREISSVELVIPVAKLASGESGLDENLRKALHASVDKYITFHITSYEVQAPADTEASLGLLLHGRLSVAGVGQDIDITASGVPNAVGLRVTGSKDILMSAYNVEAPTFMLGMMKTKDQVTIKFDLTLQRRGAGVLTIR